VLCITVSIIVSIVIVYVVKLFDSEREKILGSFYEIPNEFVIRLSERCLRYSDILRVILNIKIRIKILMKIIMTL